MNLSTNKLEPKLLVCTQMRYAPNPLCCSNNGSQAILSELQKAVKDHNLNIEVVASRCMLMCEDGPNIKLNPSGKVWSHVTIETITEIIETCRKSIK